MEAIIRKISNNITRHMKKILMGIGVGVVCAFLLAIGGSAHAQEVVVNQPTQELPAENAAALKGALDVLGATLDTLEMSIEQNTEVVAASAPEITATLNAISTNLESLDSTLIAFAYSPAFAETQMPVNEEVGIVSGEETSNELLANTQETAGDKSSGWLTTAQWIVALLVILGIGAWIWFSGVGRSKQETQVVSKQQNLPATPIQTNEPQQQQPTSQSQPTQQQ